MNRLAFLAGCAVLLSAFAPGVSHAAEPTLIADHGSWASYKFIDEDGNKVCYMSGTPDKKEGKYNARGDVFALITNRPSEKSKDVFSYIAGYTYKTGSDVKLKVNGQSFTLFTQDETAWAQDAAADAKIAAALRKGSTLIVSGTSSKGNHSTDTFSLAGSSAAHDDITRECAK